MGKRTTQERIRSPIAMVLRLKMYNNWGSPQLKRKLYSVSLHDVMENPSTQVTKKLKVFNVFQANYP